MKKVPRVNRQGHESESEQTEKGGQPDRRLAASVLQDSGQTSHERISVEPSGSNIPDPLFGHETRLQEVKPDNSRPGGNFVLRGSGLRHLAGLTLRQAPSSPPDALYLIL